MSATAKRSSKRKILNLTKRLRDQIQNGEIPDGTALPTPEELARRNGTSAITINRIMTKLSEEGLVTRIKGRGTFANAATPSARQLTIGIADRQLTAQSSDLDKVMSKITSYCLDKLQAPNITLKNISFEEFSQLTENSEQIRDLDGMLLNHIYYDDNTKKIISHFNFPVVMYHNEYIEDAQIDQVIPDLSTSTDQIISNLHTDMFDEVVIVYESHPNGLIRKQTFKNALLNTGYDAHKIVEIEPSCLGKADGGYRIGCKLANTPKRRFIYCTSDFISFGIYDALIDNNQEINQDLQLLSFDDLEGDGFSTYPQPILSSINASRNLIAQKAVELLLKKIETPDPCNYIIKVPTKVVIRKTTFNTPES